MWHLPSLLRIANLVQYQSLLLRKFEQNCAKVLLATGTFPVIWLPRLVNPFFSSSRKNENYIKVVELKVIKTILTYLFLEFLLDPL